MSDITFADRLKAVIGDEHPTPWATDRGISAATIHEWLTKGVTPYPKTMAKLVSGTGIPKEWWLRGELPPPQPGADTSKPNAVTESRPDDYLKAQASIDSDLLQGVIDFFYAWLDENKDVVRIDRGRHGAVIAVLYRIASQVGEVRKLDMEQVLRLAA